MVRIDINNRNLWYLCELAGEKIYVNQTMLATWVVMGALIIFAVVVRIMIGLGKFTDVPKGFQNFLETAVEMMENLTKNNMGERFGYFSAYFFFLFAFILVSNYSGMFGLRPPTTDLATTAALGITTLAIMTVMGIKCQKGAYFKEYLKPFFLFLPMNIIGELAKAVSLSFRLFGNLLGGLIIIELIYSMLPIFVTIVIPSFVHAFFDVFFGGLQAFVFTMLSMTFIKLKTVED